MRIVKGVPADSEEPVMRDNGKWYRAQWELLLMAETKPKIVVINSFNEYAVNTAVFPADTFNMENGMEKWYDEKGNLSTTMYWDMTKDYIEQYRTGIYKFYD